MKSYVLEIIQYCDIEVNVSKQVKGVKLSVHLFPSGKDNIEISQFDFNLASHYVTVESATIQL